MKAGSPVAWVSGFWNCGLRFYIGVCGNQERKCLGFSLEERCVHSDTSGALRVLRDLLQLAEKVSRLHVTLQFAAWL